MHSGLREKDMAKKRYRDDLRQFSQLQEALRQQEKRDLEEEDKRIAAFLVERHAKEDKRKQDDNDRKGRSAQLAERIGEKLLEEEVCVIATRLCLGSNFLLHFIIIIYFCIHILPLQISGFFFCLFVLKLFYFVRKRMQIRIH